MDKAYLLVYIGNCASTTINGIKFADKIRTASVSEERVKDFMSADGTPLYDTLEIHEIKKDYLIPEDKKEVTTESLKQGNTLAQLQEMARSLNLDDGGSKTELAERIVAAAKAE